MAVYYNASLDTEDRTFYYIDTILGVYCITLFLFNAANGVVFSYHCKVR